MDANYAAKWVSFRCKSTYLSNTTLEKLKNEVLNNLDRYKSGNFFDLMSDGEWAIELGIEVDLSLLADLDPTVSPEAEIKNSCLVWESLRGLSPSLAYEEGIWVRLTHVECLNFSRARWLTSLQNDEKSIKSVRSHFFANTLTRRRDDNAISRLWWNAYIANQVAGREAVPALRGLLKTADIRANIIERSLIGSRSALVGGILRLMNSWPKVTQTETSFRALMKVVNKMGGGIVFEAMTTSEVDNFLVECLEIANMNRSPTI